MFQAFKSISCIDFRMYKTLYRQRIEELRLQNYRQLNYAEGVLSSEEDFWYDTDAFLKLGDSFVCIWSVEGKYISALRVEGYKDGYLLTNLETDPDYRNKGYASLLIDALKDYLASCGCKFLYAHIAKRNRLSLMVHQKLGFQSISEVATLVDGTVSSNFYTLRADLQKNDR